MKKTPTRAGGMVLLNAVAVLAAISYGVTLALPGLVDPLVTILGFKRHPSKNTFYSYKALVQADKTLSVTF